MSNIWFTSDLHLGHRLAAEKRGFTSVEDHDNTIIENYNSIIGKRDKVFILGDLAFTSVGLNRVKELTGVKEVLMGNHDRFKIHKYLDVVQKIHGFRTYKGFWLSHCPIHPQEIYRCKGNIHGHIHSGAATQNLYLPYFNVNVDFHNLHPVNFDVIMDIFGE